MIKRVHFLFVSFFFLLFSFYAGSQEISFANPEEFTDAFVQTVFESENWDQAPLFLEEIKDYFDFKIIGRGILGIGYRDFSDEEFRRFVEVFPHFEISRLLSYLENFSGELDFEILRKPKGVEKKSGTLFNVDYKYKLKSSQESDVDEASDSSIFGYLSFKVLKKKNQDSYKIIGFSLEGVNWLIDRKRYYNELMNQGKTPAEIIDIISH